MWRWVERAEALVSLGQAAIAALAAYGIGRTAMSAGWDAPAVLLAACIAFPFLTWGGYGLKRWLIERNRQQEGSPEPLSERWVQDQLSVRHFPRLDVQQWAGQCLERLRANALLTRASATEFFAAVNAVRQGLNEVYRSEFERDVDAVGYCTWGPVLYHVRPHELGIAKDYLRQSIKARGDWPPGSFEFYDSRNALRAQRPLSVQLETAEVMWALWNTGTQAHTERAVASGRVQRLILPNPNGESVQLMASAVQVNADSIANDIRALTQQAVDARVPVRWSRILASNTILFGNPGSGADSWLHVELLQPMVPAQSRPSFRISRARYPKLYDAYLKAYTALWEQSVEPSATNAR
jgi:hypothetical protein